MKKIKFNERDVLKSVCKYLQYRKDVVLFGRTNTAGTYDPVRQCRRKNPYLFKGFPDICGFVQYDDSYKETKWKRTKLFFIECKSSKGAISFEQDQFKGFADKTTGVIYIVARSVEDVEAKL